MARSKKPPLPPSVAGAMELLRVELARLDAIDRGESVPEDLALARAEIAECKRALVAETREVDCMRRERDAAIESRDRANAQAATNMATATANQSALTRANAECSELRRQVAELRTISGCADPGEALATMAAVVHAGDAHDGLCWRALVDAVRVMPGALVLDTRGEAAAESEANLDHPLGEIACAMLRASPDDLGALPAAQIIASELHALVRDAAAWRAIERALADGISNESDREAIGTSVYDQIERTVRSQSNAEHDRTWGRGGRSKLAPFAAWDAAELGRALGEAAAHGIVEAQAMADKDAMAADDAEAAEQDRPEPRDDHAVWWRTFVAAACGSSKEDGDARRLSWAMRRARLPVTSTDDTIETVEACGLLLGEILDRLEANRVA